MRALAVVLISGIALAGCARSLSPDVYSRGEVGAKVEVEDAVLLSSRDVRIEGTRSNVGAGVGAVVGGVGGSYAGKGSDARLGVLGAIAGAVVGAVVGAAVEEAATESQGVEYLVRLPDGETVAVVQPKGATDLQPGDHVLLVYGDHIRVVPAPDGRPLPEPVEDAPAAGSETDGGPPWPDEAPETRTEVKA